MSKLVKEVVKKCSACPHHYFEADPDPMGQNGWDRCRKQNGKYIGQIMTKYGIDPDCPLPDAPKQ